MFKKLHRQLIFFCCLIMTAILLAMTAICLSISESALRRQSFADFRNNADTVLTHLDNQTIVSLSWLSQIEHNYHLTIDILDNGTPLLYGSLSDTQNSRCTLADAARQAAAETYGLDTDSFRSTNLLRQQEVFHLELPSMPQYYACVALLPKDNRFLDIAILYSTEQIRAQIMHQRLLFLAGTAISLLILTLLAWIFIGRMLNPLEENRRKQVQFVAAASHELRSPLTVILSSLSALRMSLIESDTRTAATETTDYPYAVSSLSDRACALSNTASTDNGGDSTPKNTAFTEVQRFADTIENEGKRMSRLIDDMLMLANADNNSWSIHPHFAELDTLLIQTFEKYEPIARSKKCRLLIKLPDDMIAPCPCDEQRISQLLAILIDNALSYTPENGTITLSLRTQPGRFELSVSDNGPGIPDAQKRAVFERFYRMDDAHQSKDHFGLGLCIAREIIRLHRGKLLLTDTPGGGATFTIVLPGEK